MPLRSLVDGERAEIVRCLIGSSGPLAERKAFTRPDVVRLAVPMLYGYATDELDRVVSGVIGHREAIPLVGQPGARGRAWAAASALATEAAIAAVAERLADRHGKVAVELPKVRAAIAAKEAALGQALTQGQRQAAEAITTSGRGLDLVVGVAGSGKTTSLEVVRTAFEAEGYRVLGTAISGQAARALHDEAGVESRTIASLVWRMGHGKLRLDDRTVLLIDEAGMTDDPAMLKLLAAVDVVGAKAVVIGDHRQLGAVGPGGGLEALVNRHVKAVHVLGENVRQRDTGERHALEALRAGKVGDAVDWYQRNDRLEIVATRMDAVETAVDAWHADVRAGSESVLLAWRRVDVAALNDRARKQCVKDASVTGPELEAPGGKRYAAGDRVVTLAPSADGRFVTSERASVVRVSGEALHVRFADGQDDILSRDELAKDRLDHAYAVTLHRMQGATVDRAHVLADGGGRELAYVAMSRAGESTHVYVVADDTDQAVDDLTKEWGTERRQRWLIDTDKPAGVGAPRRPDLARRADSAIRLARLRAEHDAVEAVAPDAEGRLAALRAQLRLEQVVPAAARGIGLP